MVQNNVRVNTALAGAAIAAAGFCSSAKATVVIQEFYGDGGYTAGDTFTNDYVDLYNAGTSAVNINGYVLEVGNYSNALYTTEPITLVDATPLAPGAYFLIEGHAAGTNPSAATFPTANQYATQAPSALGLYPSYAAGKVALFDITGLLQDYVGYGDSAANGTAPAYEGTGEAAGVAYPVFSGTNALTRTVFTDATATGPDTSTEDNLTDFVNDTPNPQVTAAVVPEPTTLGLIAAGGAMLIARRRKA